MSVVLFCFVWQGHLGLTLLPHSGVSLEFARIAASVLEGSPPEYAPLIQGTIAAAAVINEIIAVFMAKKGFEWAGELGQSGKYAASARAADAGSPVSGKPSGTQGKSQEGIRFRVLFLI